VRSRWFVPSLFVALFVVVLAGATCGDNGTKVPKDDAGKSEAVAARAQFDLFVFGRVRGTIAPWAAPRSRSAACSTRSA
jgi:hypothetical protein